MRYFVENMRYFSVYKQGLEKNPVRLWSFFLHHLIPYTDIIKHTAYIAQSSATGQLSGCPFTDWIAFVSAVGLGALPLDEDPMKQV